MLAALIDHLWQSTLFTAGVGVLTLLVRRNSARIRFGLWLCASLKFLVPFAALTALGSSLPRSPPAPGTVNAGVQVFSAAVGRVVTLGPLTGHAMFAGAPEGTSGLLFPGLLVLAWFCGVLALTIHWFLGWRRIRRAVANSVPAAVDFPIPVRTSPLMHEPAVAGIVRPILLLPAGIEDWLSREQLRAILAHERCHVGRRDNLAAALHMVVEAGFWFHPLVWWLGARLIAERERACDEEVLAGGHKARDYAAAILRVCQNYLQSPLRCAAGVGGGNLTRRIECILNRPRLVRLGTLKIILLAVTAGAVIAEPVVSGHLDAPPAQDPGIDTSTFRNYMAVIPAKPGLTPGARLLIAASNNNLAQIRTLLHEGVPVDYEEPHEAGITALTQAAQQGHATMVIELLKNGAAVEHRRADGTTALILGAGSGSFPVVEALLNAGAQVNDRESGGGTALMDASAKGYEGVVQLLLIRGADVHFENHAGQTALELAAMRGNEKVISLLLSAGADPRHRQFDGETALDLAAQGRHVAAAQVLLEKGMGSEPGAATSSSPNRWKVLSAIRIDPTGFCNVSGSQCGSSAPAQPCPIDGGSCTGAVGRFVPIKQ